jgi:hypothetical protein
VLVFNSQSILCGRETTEFLVQRQDWIAEVSAVADDLLLDEVVAQKPQQSHNNAPSAATKRPLTSLTGAYTAMGSPVPSKLTNFHTPHNGVIDMNILAALLQQSDFPASSCEEAVRATHNAGVDAALTWLFQHIDGPAVQDPVPRLRTTSRHSPEGGDLEQGPPDHVAPSGASILIIEPAHDLEHGVTSTSEPAPVTHHTTVTMRSPGVQRLLGCIVTLQRGISTGPSSTHLSRQVLTVLMSRKLPSDVCWLIFGYTTSAHEIRRVLLDRSVQPEANDTSMWYYDYRLPPPVLVGKKKQRGSSGEKTLEYLRFASHYLRVRQELIAQAKISV